MTGIERLHEIMTRLRDPEKGCPWDREQTLESLKPCVLEETHELLAAMDRPEDKANYIEELGDVLLQVVLHSQIAAEAGAFTIDDVCAEIDEKMIRRHPHVFGQDGQDGQDTAAKENIPVSWKQIKAAEKKGREWEEPYLFEAFTEAESLIGTARNRKLENKSAPA
jgi:tetrapyrrole methylase family protein/MazG family protein